MKEDISTGMNITICREGKIIKGTVHNKSFNDRDCCTCYTIKTDNGFYGFNSWELYNNKVKVIALTREVPKKNTPLSQSEKPTTNGNSFLTKWFLSEITIIITIVAVYHLFI